MKRTLNRRWLLKSVFAVLLALIPLSPLNAQFDRNSYSEKRSISAIYAFGDSLSDTGNLDSMTGGALPGPGYHGGRFSNGLVWVEYLGEMMGLKPASIVSYAYGGATTGHDNYHELFGFGDLPGLQDEIDFFLQDLDGNPADDQALYIIWVGANDLFVYGASPQTFENAMINTAIAVQRLYLAGARNILVVNLPDLGLTPYGISVDPSGLSFVTSVYNDALNTTLNGLAASGLPTIRLDSAALIQDIVTKPRKYQLSNVTDPCLLTGDDPSRCLFWDGIHPTTAGHEIIAKEASIRIQRGLYRN